MVRETFFVNALRNSKVQISSSKDGDCQIGDMIFEIGGENKTFKQVRKHKENGYLVLDNIVVGDKNIIPLYLFGFGY